MKQLILDKLNQTQVNKMRQLIDLCTEKEPITLTVPLSRAGVFLSDERYFVLYEDGQLVSMAHLFYPDHIVGELIGFTHPDFRKNHYFGRLLSKVMDYAETIGLDQVYVISDGKSPDAAKALDALGLDTEYTEYMLGKVLDISAVSEPTAAESFADSHRETTVLETDSSPLTAELFSKIFQTDPAQCKAYLEDISSDERIHNYVLSLNGTHIGQTQLTFMGDMAYISGFGILPEYRRQGMGLKFLHQLERLLAEQSIRRFTLQVSSQNKTALSLYRKDGFEVLEALHYYPLFEEE